MRSRSDAAVISRPPSLPIAITAKRPPGTRPARAREFDPRPAAEVRRRCFRRYWRRRARHFPPSGVPSMICTPTRKRLFLREAPCRIERGFEVGRPRHLLVQRRIERIAAGKRGQKVRVHQRIERGGRLRQMRGQARRRAGDLGHQPEQFRPREEQREQLHAGRQIGEEAVELRERRVGIGARRQRRAAAPARAWSEARARGRCAWRGCGRDASRGSRSRRDAASRKPMALIVASVSGSSSTPVKTRLPSAPASGASRSNSRA